MSRMIGALVLLMALGAMPGVAQEVATALVMAGGQAFIEGDLAEGGNVQEDRRRAYGCVAQFCVIRHSMWRVLERGHLLIRSPRMKVNLCVTLCVIALGLLCFHCLSDLWYPQRGQV